MNQDIRDLFRELCPRAYAPIAIYYTFGPPRRLPLGTIVEDEPAVIPEEYFVALLSELEERLIDTPMSVTDRTMLTDYAGHLRTMLQASPPGLQ
jgi:hypothetical protein